MKIYVFESEDFILLLFLIEDALTSLFFKQLENP